MGPSFLRWYNTCVKKIPLLHIVLFMLTALSTVFVGALQSGGDPLSHPADIRKGVPFALSLLTILLTHEFAHYFASRRHRVKATLPYFVPAPTIIGTFGAFIKMKSPIVTRKALIDIGASGPIAGFIVSLIAVVVGLSTSEVVSVAEKKDLLHLGDSLLFSFLSRLVIGTTPANADIFLSPVAFAGWIGFFVTSINLIPVGQLDGGHIAFAFLGEKHARLSFMLVLVMIVLGLVFWEGWLVWALLLVVIGMKHPPVVYWEETLDPRRRFVGLCALFIFVLTFVPVPFRIA